MHCSTRALSSSLLIMPSELVSSAIIIFLTSWSVTSRWMFILLNTAASTTFSSAWSRVPDLSVSYF